MDLTPYVESVRTCEAELRRRNAEATQRARHELAEIVKVLRADRRVGRSYLFGSLAKGAFHPRSDIDIAVSGLNLLERDDLRDRLQAVATFRVDVRDLDSTSGFRDLVEFYGERLDAEP